jgi:hypothetical protein
MENITVLLKAYMRLMYGEGGTQACIDWAVERLQNDEEAGDTDIRLLAGASKGEEAKALVPKILERYMGPAMMNPEQLCGKYIVELHQQYVNGEISIIGLEPVLWRMYQDISSPGWLVMLSRNCEYATDVEAFIRPFEDEFAYIAGLWEHASSYEDFIGRYDRKVSNSHDVKGRE